MAKENYAGVSPIPFKAGAAITQHRAVKLDTTADRVVHAVAIADPVIGVSLETATAANDPMPIQIHGVAKIEAAAAITLGDEVMVQAAAANGRITVAAGATARSIGFALNTVANAGELVSVLLHGPTAKGPANR